MHTFAYVEIIPITTNNLKYKRIMALITCPECGKPVDGEFTRIVGFYTKIKTWGKERKKEYQMRKWEGINKTTEELQ